MAVRRYSRQIALADVGAAGQETICRAIVTLTGTGLAVETAARYLEAAGVKQVARAAASREAPQPGATIQVGDTNVVIAPAQNGAQAVLNGARAAAEALWILLGK